MNKPRRPAEPAAPHAPATPGAPDTPTNAAAAAGARPGRAAGPPTPVRPAPIAVGKPPHAPGQSAPSEAGVGLPLPHERDESIGMTAATPDPAIEQARRDLAAGQVDTDLRATPGLDAQRRKDLLRPKR